MALEATNSAPELRWTPEVARIEHSEPFREKYPSSVNFVF
jgi:hypothetical protein